MELGGFGLDSLFNCISTFVGYLMPELPLQDISDIIYTVRQIIFTKILGIYLYTHI